MGVNLRELFERKEITLSDLKGKIIAVDAHNMLYQFLANIRGPDGSLFTDKKGKVTSHLIGLFSRTSGLMKEGIKPVFVFDGVPPELKAGEIARRTAVKTEAKKQFETAKEEGNVEEMKKYAARTCKLTPEMTAEAKKLLTLLGLPVVQAPSEGEAQASYMCKKGDCYAVASQDYDSLLYGAPKLIQNLSISGRRKDGRVISPTILERKSCTLTDDQLITVALLVGTDYNLGGIHGIGPKKALKLVTENTNEKIFELVKWDFSEPWQEIFNAFKTMPTTNEYPLTFKSINTKEIMNFLVEEHDFSAERVTNTLKGLEKANQRALGDFQ